MKQKEFEKILEVIEKMEFQSDELYTTDYHIEIAFDEIETILKPVDLIKWQKQKLENILESKYNRIYEELPPVQKEMYK